MSEQHYWVSIEKNPLSKQPGPLMFNMYEVRGINVVLDAATDKVTVVQVSSDTSQFNLDGCGADQFLEAWDQFQTAEANRKFRYVGIRPEKGTILRASVEAMPSDAVISR